MLNKTKSFADAAAIRGKSTIDAAVNKMAPYMFPALAGMTLLPNLACAEGSAASLIGAVLAVLCVVLKYVGIVVIAVGFILFLLNMHDDNPEKKQKIIITIVIGAAMFGGQKLLQTICTQAGLGITINTDNINI